MTPCFYARRSLERKFRRLRHLRDLVAVQLKMKAQERKPLEGIQRPREWMRHDNFCGIEAVQSDGQLLDQDLIRPQRRALIAERPYSLRNDLIRRLSFRPPVFGQDLLDRSSLKLRIDNQATLAASERVGSRSDPANALILRDHYMLDSLRDRPILGRGLEAALLKRQTFQAAEQLPACLRDIGE